MKKKIVLLLTLMVMLMAACGNTANADTAGNIEENIASDGVVDAGSSTVENTAAANAAADNTTVDAGPADVVFDTLPVNQLMFGIIMLETTDYAVTPEQAQTLLPLWQLAQTLANSNTTAEEEIQVVAKQIQGGMNAEQLTYIVGQEFNAQDVIAALGEMGIDPGIVAGGGGREGGAAPGEGTPGGGEQRAPSKGGGNLGAAFYEIVIQLLEGKLGS